MLTRKHIKQMNGLKSNKMCMKAYECGYQLLVRMLARTYVFLIAWIFIYEKINVPRYQNTPIPRPIIRLKKQNNLCYYDG